MFTVLLLFLQLISSTSTHLPTPIGFDQCTLDLETLLLNTTTIPNGPDILSAWGLGQGDLGSYSICATYEQQKYHYCWMGTDITRAIGLCVPATCTQKVLLRNIDVIVDVVEHLKYNASLDIFKAGCTQLEPFDTSAYITSISIATLVLIFTVSSIASWRKRCFTCMERGCDCVGQRNPFASNASNNNVSTLDYWNLGWSQHAPGIENSPAATTMTWNNEQTMEQGVDSGGCEICQKGRYISITGQSQCLKCPTGRKGYFYQGPRSTSPLLHNSIDDCEPCEVLYYNPFKGLDKCFSLMF